MQRVPCRSSVSLFDKLNDWFVDIGYDFLIFITQFDDRDYVSFNDRGYVFFDERGYVSFDDRGYVSFDDSLYKFLFSERG